MASIEKSKGVQGYMSTEQTLEKISSATAALNQTKGKTLEEISKIVTDINSNLNLRKNRLAPQIKRLREVRSGTLLLLLLLLICISLFFLFLLISSYFFFFLLFSQSPLVFSYTGIHFFSYFSKIHIFVFFQNTKKLIQFIKIKSHCLKILLLV